MEKFMTTKEASEKWNITERRINVLCKVFFERSKEDTSVYFKDKKIWRCGKEYRDYQGKYPVIYVTFKDVKCDNWENAYDLIYKIIRNEIERHSELLNSDKISAYEKKVPYKYVERRSE